MNFIDEEKARDIAIYYAEKLDDKVALALLKSNNSKVDADKAASISRFYWNMLDLAVFDQESGNKILDESDMEYWMSRLMNIISGFLEETGFQSVWDNISDEVN